MMENELIEEEPNYCSVCDGTGMGQRDGCNCFSCKGTGVIQPKDDDFDYTDWSMRQGEMGIYG
jgi:DnaJ-class molecular chaperone